MPRPLKKPQHLLQPKVLPSNIGQTKTNKNAGAIDGTCVFLSSPGPMKDPLEIYLFTMPIVPAAVPPPPL